MADGYLRQTDLLKILLDSARLGFGGLWSNEPLEAPGQIPSGLPGVGIVHRFTGCEKIRAMVDENIDPGPMADILRTSMMALMGFEPLIETIEQYWLEPANQAAESWTGHLEINRGDAGYQPGP